MAAVGTTEPGRVVVEGFASADFDPFYTEHYGPMTRALVLALRRDTLAREAARQAFGRALHHWDTLHTHRHPEGWVFRTALDWARRRVKHHPPLERPTAGAEHHPGFHGATDRALARLDLTDRAILVMRHHLAWPPADIAAALRLPRPAVAWRLRVALRTLSRDTMIPADEADTHLAWHLSAAAADVAAERPPAEAITSPAQRRSRGVVIGVVAAVAVVFAAIAVLAPGRSRPPDTTAAAGLVVDDPEPEDERVVFAQPGPVLDWEAADLPPGITISHLVATPTGFLAFEGFDTPAGPRRLWRSDDGLRWTVVDADLSPFGPSEIVYTVAAHGDLIVAAGGPQPEVVNLGPAGDLAVWTSADGTMWQRRELSVAGDTSLDPPLGHAPAFADVAAGAAGVVVVAHRTFALDPAALPVDARALLDEGFDPMIGIDGIELTDAYGLVALRIPFAEIAAEFAPLFRDTSPPTVWASPDGHAWQRAGGLDASFVAGLAATPEGFVASGLAAGPATEWFSPDGITWTERPTEALASGLWRPVAFGDGGLATLTQDADVRLLPPGRELAGNLAALPGDADFRPFALFGGEAGLIAAGFSEAAQEEPFEQPEESVVAIEQDGRRLSVSLVDTPRLTVIDVATGEEMLTLYGLFPGASGTLPVDVAARTFSVLDPDTGEVLFEAGWEDWRAAWEGVLEQARPDVLPPPDDTAVWFSPDGRRWSLQTTTEAFGAPGLLVRAAVGADRVVAVVDDRGGQSTHVGRLAG